MSSLSNAERKAKNYHFKDNLLVADIFDILDNIDEIKNVYEYTQLINYNQKTIGIILTNSKRTDETRIDDTLADDILVDDILADDILADEKPVDDYFYIPCKPSPIDISREYDFFDNLS